MSGIDIEAKFESNFETYAIEYEQLGEKCIITASIKNNNDKVDCDSYVAVYDSNDILQCAEKFDVSINESEELNFEAKLNYVLKQGDKIVLYL